VTTTGNNITKGIAPAEGFAEHAESQAGLAGARQARAETAGLTAWQTDAGMAPERPGEGQAETAVRHRNARALTQWGARALPTPERSVLGRAQEVHLHFHGVSAEDVAAIIARQDKAGE
jgi:hypothetical protein